MVVSWVFAGVLVVSRWSRRGLLVVLVVVLVVVVLLLFVSGGTWAVCMVRECAHVSLIFRTRG